MAMEARTATGTLHGVLLLSSSRAVPHSGDTLKQMASSKQQATATRAGQQLPLAMARMLAKVAVVTT